MAHLQLREGFLERLKRAHGIPSDAALAAATGVSHRTITRVRANPSAIQGDLVAGICVVFGYSPSDVVEAQQDKAASA